MFHIEKKAKKYLELDQNQSQNELTFVNGRDMNNISFQALGKIRS